MADTPPGAGYVSGPYDHTNDVPPHQHGGTDAPECTTCQPWGFDRQDRLDNIDAALKIGRVGEVDQTSIGPIDARNEIHIRDSDNEFAPDADHIMAPKLTPVDRAIYYGTAPNLRSGEFLRALQDRARRTELSERPDYIEWARDALAERLHDRLWHNRPVGVPAESGRAEGELPAGVEAFIYATGGWPMVIRDEHNRSDMAIDEQGMVNPERKWKRTEIQQLIRQELTVLGLNPGSDGFFTPPPPSTTTPREPDGDAPDGHYWDGYKWVELEPRGQDEWVHIHDFGGYRDPIRLPSGQRCLLCGKEERPIIDWDRIRHFRVFFGGEWLTISKDAVQAVRED